MFRAMETTLHIAASARLQLTLAVALLLACLVNLALVWAWL
jgi:hypothetical protein